MKKVFALAFMSATALTVLAPHARANVMNLVQNGTFDDSAGYLNHWTSSGSVFNDRPSSVDSNCDYVSNGCGVSQTINTVAGDLYDISFQLSGSYPEGDNPGSGGELLWGGSVITNESYGGGTLMTFSVNGLAASGSTTSMQFILYDPPSREYLTNVSVVDEASLPAGSSGTAVPEPGSLTLLASMGLLGLGATRLMRRNSLRV